ncbi:hypothetical protein CRE_28317 [Caenorhabditis remanei]|uniref:Uncharacterized protein n=1 Tax=Caenorhabditis remanei TaxID=31234 RepID=E3LLT3_CAERE|nr:hypothetical protein CRE_28317 [Caenorhabditis remanei]
MNIWKMLGTLTKSEEKILKKWYLDKLCATRKEHCRGIVDQVISKFCEDNKDTDVCKNESPEKGITGGALADAVTKAAEATTKGKMNMMLIGGVVAVILFLVIGVGLYFFCMKSSSPSPPSAAAVNTRNTQSTPKKRRKKRRKKHGKKKKTKKETTSGAESTTKSPVSKAKMPEDVV